MGEAEMRLKPITHKAAKAFVKDTHRHLKPPVGAVFVLSVVDDDDVVRGVAIVGRPVARMLDDGITLEVTRVATDGARNACSMLYGAAVRIAKSMGYARIVTYTLPEEGGASLRASGWKDDGPAGGGNWGRASRERADAERPDAKTRWTINFTKEKGQNDT
jgi:hypothetical protein